FMDGSLENQTDIHVDGPARVRNELILDHVRSRDTEGLAQAFHRTDMAAGTRVREFFADSLREDIFDVRMSFTETAEAVIEAGDRRVDFQGERIPIFRPALQDAQRQRSGIELSNKVPF